MGFCSIIILFSQNYYFQGIDPKLEKESVEESLESVGLTEFADRPVKELSGGMKRRVSLAVSLCGNARVVFLGSFFFVFSLFYLFFLFVE